MKANKMHGFLCQSNASTAVCIPGDPRSVIVPRRPDRTLVDHARVADLRYARLVDPPRRFAAGAGGGGGGGEKRIAFAEGGVPTKTARRGRSAGAGPPKVTARATAASGPPPSLPSTLGDVFQVVVMRVSIHCQGCAGKVKKHISKMEGVTSFSIDLESKRVTVMGHISPVAVLERISRVKKAEFWHG